jgi:hypothetical protein
MKRVIGLVVVLAVPVGAFAQPTAPITATPLLPPSVQYPPPDQTLQPAPAPSPTGTEAPSPQPDAAQNTPPVAPASPQPMQLTWQPQGTALLQVLDKVNAQNAVLTVKVGQQAQFGSLNIAVQACDSHPSDQPQDSAAYLTITDSHADAPGFRGWMLANNPSVSMLQHPIYDVRVVGCRA